MAKLGFLIVALLVLLELTFAAHSPAPAPAPAPSLGADSLPQRAPSPITESPDTSPEISPVTHASPPSPSDLEPVEYSPASSPAPSPEEASDINHSNINAKEGEENIGGDGGMSGGKKAGIAVGVLVAAGLVVVAGFIYKKRQDNIRRSRYGNNVGIELL